MLQWKELHLSLRKPPEDFPFLQYILLNIRPSSLSLSCQQINIEEEIFPVLAICLGYEFMITAVNNDKNILKECEIFYQNCPLKFVSPTENSTLFSRMTERQKNILETQNSTVNYHV